MDVLTNSNLVPSASYTTEIRDMMFGFGDFPHPSLESATLVEEIVREQMVEVLFRAAEVADTRGSRVIALEGQKSSSKVKGHLI